MKLPLGGGSLERPEKETAHLGTTKLRVAVAGGGPVGLSFSLKLSALLGDAVEIDLYDARWITESGKVAWRLSDGAAPRQHVVTLQSRLYTQLPDDVQRRLFRQGCFSEMWPLGRESPAEIGWPRNLRMADVEAALLACAATEPSLRLHAEPFDAHRLPEDLHLLVVAEGARSPTREIFADRFGRAEETLYSLDGKSPFVDRVLGLQVTSDLPDAAGVLLTISQNRFLLNSLHGDGILNMRLTAEEAEEFASLCPRSEPAPVAGGSPSGGRAIDPRLFATQLWPRIEEGLRLFSIRPDTLRGVGLYDLSMVQRSRFTAPLRVTCNGEAATTLYGCLLGDAANALHFWPGRGLNAGLAGAFSLAYALARQWTGGRLRDTDFMRHEAVMAMLQYRQKTRAWAAMVTPDSSGRLHAIRDLIGRAIATDSVRVNAQDEFFAQLRNARTRLAGRLPEPLPDDRDLMSIVRSVEPRTVEVLLASGAWDTFRMGGEEVDVATFHGVADGQACGISRNHACDSAR